MKYQTLSTSSVKNTNNKKTPTLSLNMDNVTNLPSVSSINNKSQPTMELGLGSLNTNTNTVYILLFIVSIYVILTLISSVFQPTTGETKTRSLLETVLILIFVLLITANALKYLFNIDIKATLANIFSKEPELDIEVNKIGKFGGEILEEGENILGELGGIGSLSGNEVFNISDNIYTYEDAKGICGAFGGRLANYFDIENAYKNGGEWCNYGWSDDQMVFYPTQRATYERLKKEGRQNECGRPGVNGGFIGNPNARFGVNCVGKKPKITPEEQDMMNEMNLQNDTQNKKDKNKWSSKLSSMTISPFNSNTW